MPHKPRMGKTRMRRQDENSIQGKKYRGPNQFSHLNWSHQVLYFVLSLDLHYLYLLNCQLIFFITLNQGLIAIRLSRSFELMMILGFMKRYPTSPTLWIQGLYILKLGMKQGLGGQTRAQRQGDFMDDNSSKIQKT